MNETIFTYDVNIDKFKSFISKSFWEKQLEDIVSAIYLYIEIVWTEEMNKRVHSKLFDNDIETKLQWVAELASMFNDFLKKTWQK